MGARHDQTDTGPTAPGDALPSPDPPPDTPETPDPWEIPRGLDVAAGLAWRLLLIAAAAFVVIYLAGTFSVVLIPVVLALIAASLLAPEAHLMSTRVRWLPHAVATAIVVVGGLAVVGGVFTGVVFAFISGLPQLTSQLTNSLSEIQNWVRSGPLGLNNQQFTAIGDQILTGVQQSQATIASSALGAVSTVGELVTEGLLALFTVIFLVHDGGTIWRFLLQAVPRRARPRADLAGRRAFASLVGYTRAIVVVAFIDAVTAGLGLWAIGVPLAVPLAALIFFGAFVPTVGAVVSGAVAALVALVSGGVTDMLLVVALLLAVQNLEGYILQPLFLGKSIKLHPLAVVLPIACGLVVAGIPGALLAVPLVTVLDNGVRSLTRSSEADVDPASVNPLDPRSARPEFAGPVVRMAPPKD
ncbi:AI-2E family transporter [Actinomycetospora endophytica]|uniref:AI-2E family transporter n=1 Tax=Actinomycetospora endophytica TaxID=2291215 RepID=A0ABS8PB52_9PSEU|nr:AI-2E family transporter [Actinomycetospora endophytica]MCD2195503.1 AI-2E family transporter [Actinomycetospora endophytica]